MITLERQSLLVSEISAADTLPRFMVSLKKMADQFGFDHVTILIAPGPNDKLIAPLVVESTIPTAFAKEFDKCGHLRNCPIASCIAESIVLRRWCLDTFVDGVIFPLKMAALMRRYKLISGLMVPICLINGNRYVIRFDGNKGLPDQAGMNEMSMIALHAFDAFAKIRSTIVMAPRILTRRELEVVRWTAQGKTSAEIGQILSLSDHTINAYMTNAMKKLDCVNRTQLVAKSIRLKLIT